MIREACLILLFLWDETESWFGSREAIQLVGEQVQQAAGVSSLLLWTEGHAVYVIIVAMPLRSHTV